MGTDFLFARPSCIRGISKIIDIGATGNLYNESQTSEEADYKALKSDWTMVGEDLRYALDEFER